MMKHIRDTISVYVVVLTGVLLLLATLVNTYIFWAFANMSGAGSDIKFIVFEHMLFWGLILVLPASLSTFVIWSPFSQRRGRGYRIIYWILFVAIAISSIGCLYVFGDDSAVFIVFALALFLYCWYPHRKARNISAAASINQ